MLAHESFGFTMQGCYDLTRVHHHGGHTLRIRIVRDYYAHQSRAHADVLTPALTWTEVASIHPSAWHGDTPLVTDTAAPLNTVALDLLHRALTDPAPLIRAV